MAPPIPQNTPEPKLPADRGLRKATMSELIHGSTALAPYPRHTVADLDVPAAAVSQCHPTAEIGPARWAHPTNTNWLREAIGSDSRHPQVANGYW